MHTSLLIPYFSFPWTFPSHRFYVLINYQKSDPYKQRLLEEIGFYYFVYKKVGYFRRAKMVVISRLPWGELFSNLWGIYFPSGCVAKINTPWPWPWRDRTGDLREKSRNQHKKMIWMVPGHGHGHGHGIFILATYPEGTWSTNPNPPRKARLKITKHLPTRYNQRFV
jgi:hypothetical protein